MSPFNPQPITLASDKVLLRPLQREDAQAFYQAGNYPELWHWVQPNHCLSLATTQRWIEQSLAEQAASKHLPYVIIDKASNQMIGSTRYCSIERANHTLEIGHTFITPAFQRTYVNSHCKFLLLQHAFEQLGAIRVEFKTHQDNNKSRSAIAGIGASFEGIIRNHRILPDGSIRSSAVFSVIDSEWPQVKAGLLAKMER